MKAVYITRFAEADNLEIREVPEPLPPVAGEVLIRVRAAGLNRADLLQRRGLYPPPPGYAPNIPGMEFAGEVAAVGENVDKWLPGDRVFGITAGEAQADKLVIDERLLTAIPARLTFTEAASIPEVFITAHDALCTQGGLKQGETLLVHAVGSGVGLAALQIAKANGAFVIGTSRTSEKLDRCKEFGMNVGIAASGDADFAAMVMQSTNDRGADVILDLVGAAYFEQNLKALSQKGRLLLVGLVSGRTAQFNMGLALSKRARIIGTVMRGRSVVEKAEATKAFAAEVVPLLLDGSVRPNLDRVFPVADTPAAYDYLESDESFGKVVLEF